MKKLSIKNWIKISLFSLFIVAFLGVLMRYKIAFELPYLAQKNIQHAHSHFAFAGWVTQLLMVLMVRYLSFYTSESKISKYNTLFWINIIGAYIMLISFIIQGYGFISILFSTISIFVFVWFAIWFYKDSKEIPSHSLSKNWFLVSLLFGVISSIGTFVLAYMMATKHVPQDLYLSSVYFYLHFQYNGWFWFACTGLFVSLLQPNLTNTRENKTVFQLFAWSCLPAYLLSVLWLKLPVWVYALAVISAIVQVFAWFKLLKFSLSIFKVNPRISAFLKILFKGIAFCVTLKLLLQFGSVFPAVSKLAFGFRPIVIAYLHLVLLAIISGFLLVYLYTNELVNRSSKTVLFLVIFIVGIFLNEMLLALQGIFSFEYILIPYANEMLFIVALILLIGISGIVFFNQKKV
ncbi:MAG TPA: hypothetical protein PLC36_04390 [Flavobacterium sp.]|jgi:hypothetical protein|nr:hypothetical protein [Flavobacterium sp.]HQX03052.1 hypothetical protein [Flavobacterium sp.]